MNDRSFVDTNVLVYLFSDDLAKQQKTDELLVSAPPHEQLVISTQILGEFANVCLRRGFLTEVETAGVLRVFIDVLEVLRIEPVLMLEGLNLRQRYGYSWWDSMMLASALEAGCTVVYTEDLHHGQTIEGRLRIENPFVAV